MNIYILIEKWAKFPPLPLFIKIVKKTIKSLAQLEYAQRFCHYGVSL